MPESSCTASRMIVTTINPPKPVAILSLNTARSLFVSHRSEWPLFPRVEASVVYLT